MNSYSKQKFDSDSIKGVMAEKICDLVIKYQPESLPGTKDKMWMDVSKNPDFYFVDIDKVAYKKGSLGSLPDERFVLREKHTQSGIEEGKYNYVFFDIKYDSKSEKTGNLPYERIKYNKPGRSEKSLCDFFLIFPTKKDNEFEFCDYFLVINHFKLRDLIRVEEHKQTIYHLQKELKDELKNCTEERLQSLKDKLFEKVLCYKGPIRINNLEREQILDDLIKIDVLIERGIAVKHKLMIPQDEKKRIEEEGKLEYEKILSNM